MERAKASYDYIKNKSISATNAAVQEEEKALLL